ncbi:somatostatin receptor type 2-like [Dendronephthya gigantea]|uniref:somatostatin receptor type 2-like n=1 Tax=Dendronephthya gigantea TaxID=151771 RepID=UPI00106A1E4E|nr:somatostatin receptor type 2-like [Dendronephthya gigantea]XP_028393425.1 somatostatin receptor type 2-like [Dendronephthya gigantea]
MADNSSICELPYSHSVGIATVNAIFCILGVVGNSLVLVAVFRTVELRTLSNFYLVALGIADFLTSAIVQPLLIVMVIKESRGECDKTLETVFRGLGNFSAAASFLVLLFITTERFLAVMKPIVYKNFHPRRRFAIFISISVIVPLVYTILRLAVSKKATSYFSAALFVLGYIYIVACYLIILLKLKRQSRKMETSTSTTHENKSSTRHAEKVVTSTMALVVGLFTIMWIPFFYFRISQPSTNSGLGYNWVRTTAISNSALNFIVYAFRMKRFRNAFKATISDGFHTMFQSRSIASTAVNA